MLDLRVDDGVIAELGNSLAVNGHRVVEGEGLVLAACVRRPARALADAWSRGRGGHRLGHAGRCRRRILRASRHGQHRPGRRFRGCPRVARRAREDGSRGPRRLLRRRLQGAKGRGAHRDDRARRDGRGRLLRRRAAGRLAGAAASRAPVQLGRRAAGRRPLRGADAHARRPRARGRSVRRARVRRLAVRRRERDGRARPGSRRVRRRSPFISCTSRPASRSRSFGARRPRG